LIPNVRICTTQSVEPEAFDASMDRCRDDWHSRPHREVTLVRGSEGSWTPAVELTFLRRYRLRNGVLADHSSFLFNSDKTIFHSKISANTEYKSISPLGLPNVSLGMLFKMVVVSMALAVMLYGTIKALTAAVKKLMKIIGKMTSYASSITMPSGDAFMDIPGFPKIPKLKIPDIPGLSPPKLSIGSAAKMLGEGAEALTAPLAILAAIALLNRYRIFKARLWPPLSGLPGLRNGLYRLPYRGFKGVFSHLPYFDQLYNAGGRRLPILGLPKEALNPGKQPMAARINKPRIEGAAAVDYDTVMKEYDFAHGVNLGKSVLVPSIILNLSMQFKRFKEKIPFMGPPTVKEMFGTESLMKKLTRALVKGAMAYGAYKATGFVAEGTCRWPSASPAGPLASSFTLPEHGLLLEQFSTGLDGHEESYLGERPAKTSPVIQAGMLEEAVGLAVPPWQFFLEQSALCDVGCSKSRRRVQLYNFL